MKQSTANKIAICLGISFFIFLACLKASHTGRIPVIPPRIPNMENSMASAIPAVLKTNKPANNNSQTTNSNTTNNTQKPSNTNTIKNDTGNKNSSTSKPVTKPNPPKPTTPVKPVNPTPTYGDIWEPEIKFNENTKTVEVILRNGMKVYDAVYNKNWELIKIKNNSTKFTPQTYKYIELDASGKDIVTHEFDKDKNLVRLTSYSEGNKIVAEYEYTNGKVAKITISTTKDDKLLIKETQTYENEKITHLEKEMYENEKLIAKYIVDYDAEGNVTSDKYFEYTYYENGKQKEIKVFYVDGKNLILDIDTYDEKGKLLMSEKIYHTLEGVKNRSVLSEYDNAGKKVKETDCRYEEDAVIYTEINEYEDEVLIKKTTTADDMTEIVEYDGTATLYKYYYGEELMEMLWEDRTTENGLTVIHNKYFDVETEKVIEEEISYLTVDERLVKLISFYFADEEPAGYIEYIFDEDGEIISITYYNLDGEEKLPYQGFIPEDLIILDNTSSIDIYIDDMLTANVDVYWNINEQYIEPVEAAVGYKFVQKNKTGTTSVAKYTADEIMEESEETHHINENETIVVKQSYEHPGNILSQIEIKTYINEVLAKSDISIFDINGIITEHIMIGYDNYGNVRTRNREIYEDGIIIKTEEFLYDTLGNIAKKTETIYEDGIAKTEYYREEYLDEEKNAWIIIERTTLLTNDVVTFERKMTQYVNTPKWIEERLYRNDDGSFYFHDITSFNGGEWKEIISYDENNIAFSKILGSNTTPYRQKDYIINPFTNEWVYIRYWQHSAETGELEFIRDATYDKEYNILYWTQKHYVDNVIANSFKCDKNGNPIE